MTRDGFSHSGREKNGEDLGNDPFRAEAACQLPILPARYADLLRKSGSLEGERKLMIAVLWAGIHDYVMYANASRGNGRARFAEVYHWMHDRTARPGLFSFEGLCDSLSIDAARLRRRVELLRRRTRPAPDRAVRIAGAACESGAQHANS